MTDELETQPGGEALPEAPAEPVDRRAAIVAALEANETSEPESTEPKADRPRDELGRFAPKTEDAPEAPEKPQEPAEPPKQRKYPSSWKPDIEPLYRRLESDPELVKILDEIERRENDFHKGVEQYKTRAQFAEAMERAIAPFMATIQAQGITPDYAVQTLFAADHKLRYGTPQEKAQAFQHLAQHYGVDLGAVPQQQVDPTTDALMREFQQLKQQQMAFLQQQQMATQAQIQAEIEQFARDKEHFEAVREDMAALMAAGRAENLQDAYEMAIWARPDIRSSLIEQQRKAEEAKRKEEAAQRAAAAKAAAVQVRGAPTAGGNPPVKDRRALIASAIDSRI